jgi:hypothetical protein
MSNDFKLTPLRHRYHTTVSESLSLEEIRQVLIDWHKETEVESKLAALGRLIEKTPEEYASDCVWFFCEKIMELRREKDPGYMRCKSL